MELDLLPPRVAWQGAVGRGVALFLVGVLVITGVAALLRLGLDARVRTYEEPEPADPDLVFRGGVGRRSPFVP